MIRNIVFDMGQVIIRFDPKIFLDRYDITEEDKQILNREVFRSVEWIMTDHGKMDETSAVNSIIPRIPPHLKKIASSLVREWYEPVIPVEGMEDFVRELKNEGYGIWLLSNAGFNQPAYWAKVPVSECFDGTMISAEVGLLKPNPGIYRLFTERFGLVPEECLFIDDNPMNVEMAICCGWKGIVFHGDLNELRMKANELGIRCFI